MLLDENYTKNSTKVQTRLELSFNEKMVTEEDFNGNTIVRKEKIIKRKKGYGMYYPKNLIQAMRLISNNQTTILLFWELVERTKKDGSVRPFKMAEIGKAVGRTRTSVYNAFKTLDKLNIVKRIGEEYRVNPFIINIQGQSEEDCANAQAEWIRCTENAQAVPNQNELGEKR